MLDPVRLREYDPLALFQDQVVDLLFDFALNRAQHLEFVKILTGVDFHNSCFFSDRVFLSPLALLLVRVRIVLRVLPGRCPGLGPPQRRLACDGFWRVGRLAGQNLLSRRPALDATDFAFADSGVPAGSVECLAASRLSKAVPQVVRH